MNNQDIIRRINEIQDKVSEAYLSWSATRIFNQELNEWKEELKDKKE